MAKNMARLDAESTVINIEWRSDRQQETADLKDCGAIPIGIGDSYNNGAYYRDGQRLMSPLEASETALAETDAAYSELLYDYILLEYGL